VRWTRRRFLTAAGAAGALALDAGLLHGAAAVNYEKTVLAKKPVAYWRLGEDRGRDAADSSGNGHKGTYLGAPTFGQKGALQGDANTAVNLDGKSSYVEVPDHADFSQPTSGKGLTIEVWVRPDVL